MQEPIDIESNLFSVRLSNKGYQFLKRVAAIAKYLLVVSLLSSVATVIFFVPRLQLVVRGSSVLTPIQVWQTYASFVYGLLIAILIPVQLYYFQKFAAGGKRSAAQHNTEGFNESFKFLVLNAVICVITYTLNLLYVLLLLI